MPLIPVEPAPNTVSYSGTFYLVYSNPQFVDPDVYFQFGIQMNYAGNGGINITDPFFSRRRQRRLLLMALHQR